MSFRIASGGEAWSTHKLINARSGRFVSWWSSWFFWLSIWALLVMWLALSVDWWSIWAIAHLSSWALLNLFCSFYALLSRLTLLCKFRRLFFLLNLLLALPELTLEWIIHQWDLRHRLFLRQHLLLIAILIIMLHRRSLPHARLKRQVAPIEMTQALDTLTICLAFGAIFTTLMPFLRVDKVTGTACMLGHRWMELTPIRSCLVIESTP